MHYCLEKSTWNGRVDNSQQKERLSQIVTLVSNENLNTFQSKSISLLGFCCDEGVKRNQGLVGAAAAPNIIRKYLASLPCGSIEKSIYDYGNIDCGIELESGQKSLAKFVSCSISNNCLPIIFGGGHETAWGTLQGVYTSKESSCILNIDAHFDLRPTTDDGLGSSGTPFYQAAQYCEKHKYNFDYNCIGIGKHANTDSLFAKAKELNVNYLYDTECDAGGIDSFYHTNLNRKKNIYLTICMDALNLSYAPGVSAPNTGGISYDTLLYIVKKVIKNYNVIAIDIVEVNPLCDLNDMTSRLAARLAWECILCL